MAGGVCGAGDHEVIASALRRPRQRRVQSTSAKRHTFVFSVLTGAREEGRRTEEVGMHGQHSNWRDGWTRATVAKGPLRVTFEDKCKRPGDRIGARGTCD